MHSRMRERPAVIVGAGALAADALGAALALVGSLNLVRDGWNGFNVLHTSASRMAGLILGYAQKGGMADIEAAKPEVVLLLGADEVDPARLQRAASWSTSAITATMARAWRTLSSPARPMPRSTAPM